MIVVKLAVSVPIQGLAGGRPTRATLVDDGGQSLEADVYEGSLEAALGVALVSGAPLENVNVRGEASKHLVRVDVTSQGTDGADRSRGRTNPRVPGVDVTVDRLNFEDKGTTLGVESVCAAFVYVGDDRIQVFTDNLSVQAALLAAQALRVAVRLVLVPQGNLKVIEAVERVPPSP